MAKAGSAQNSGYLGKKFMLSASLQTNSNEALFGQSRFDVKSFAYYADLKAAFSATYVLNRQTTIGIDFNKNTLNYATERLEENTTGFLDTRFSTDQFPLKTMLLGLNLKRFRHNNSIAPIGVYNEFELGMISYDLIDKSAVLGPAGRSLKKGQSFYLGYGFGRQQMLFKNLLVHIGIDFKFLSCLPEAFETSYSKNVEYYPSSETRRIVSIHPERKLAFSYGFNAKLGLGYILF